MMNEKSNLLTYQFEYDYFSATVVLQVDKDIFNKEHAKATLEFFIWDFVEDNDPIIEVLKKYAMEVIKVATIESLNVDGVISSFKNKEGFCKLDGSSGLKLISVTKYNFDDDKLNMELI